MTTPIPSTDTREQMLAAVRDAFAPYLERVLAQNPPERHGDLRGQFAEHMAFLADFCLRGYGGRGALTVEFIKGLHRAMFPPGYRQEVVTRDGKRIGMVPGEYKQAANNVCDSMLHPGRVNVFLPPEQVPTAMERLVGTLNAALAEASDGVRMQDAILLFVVDFLDIHPFVDANGRVICILADLLAIRAGLASFHFTAIKSRDAPTLIRAAELATEKRSPVPLYEVLAAHGWRGRQPSGALDAR